MALQVKNKNIDTKEITIHRKDENTRQRKRTLHSKSKCKWKKNKNKVKTNEDEDGDRELRLVSLAHSSSFYLPTVAFGTLPVMLLHQLAATCAPLCDFLSFDKLLH